MKGLPWAPVPGREGIEIRSRITMPREEGEIKDREAGREEAEVVPRRVRIVKRKTLRNMSTLLVAEDAGE